MARTFLKWAEVRDCCGEVAGNIGLVLLLILRAIQGICAGGELGSITAYLAETAPKEHLCLSMAAFPVTAVMAFVISSSFVAVLETTLSDEQMTSWAWRIPFLAALPPGLLSFWGRSRLQESHVQEECTTKHTAKTQVSKHGLAILLGMTATFGAACAFYSGVWCISFLESKGMDNSRALWLGCLMQIVIAVTAAVCSLLADEFQTDPLFNALWGSAAIAAAGVPVFYSLDQNPDSVLVVLLWLVLVMGVCLGMVLSGLYIYIADLFSKQSPGSVNWPNLQSGHELLGWHRIHHRYCPASSIWSWALLVTLWAAELCESSYCLAAPQKRQIGQAPHSHGRA